MRFVDVMHMGTFLHMDIAQHALPHVSLRQGCGAPLTVGLACTANFGRDLQFGENNEREDAIRKEKASFVSRLCGGEKS